MNNRNLYFCKFKFYIKHNALNIIYYYYKIIIKFVKYRIGLLLKEVMEYSNNFILNIF